ncbi:MAG TPA: oligosaccharide flippase family protein [Fluviicola sp.]|nr:oligosaccharide flippase family protein [Fluviicola sp.]
MLKKIGLLTFGQGFNILINLLFLPYMSRALDYDAYGTYGQVVLIVSTLQVFLSLGLPQIINVELSKPQVHFKEVMSNNIALCLLLGLLGVGIVIGTQDYIVAFFKNESIRVPLLVFSLSLVFSIPYNSLNTYLIYQGRVKAAVWSSIFPNTLKVAGVVLVVYYFHSVTAIVWVLLGISIIQFLWLSILAKEHLGKKVKKQVMLKQFNISLPLGFSSIIYSFILYTDSLIVSSMLGVKEFAIFRNGAFEVPFLSTLYGSVAAVILPEVSKLWQQGKKQEIAELKGKAILNTALLVYPILGVLIFYSQQLIVWYFGEAYQASAIIFSIYNLTLIFRINNYFDVLISAEKNKVILSILIISFIFNGLLCYLLVFNFQAIGGALSTVLSILLFSVLLTIYSVKLLNGEWKKYLNIRKTSFVLIFSMIMGYVFCFLLPQKVLNSESILIEFVLIVLCIVIQYYVYFKFKIIDNNIVEKFFST